MKKKIKKKYKIDSGYSVGKAKELIDWAYRQDRSYYIEVGKVEPLRSIPQNKLYRMWLNTIADETGNDCECLHGYFKGAFLERGEIIIKGQTISVEPTTTSLGAKGFSKYLEDIKGYCWHELGITLPDPEDLGRAEICSINSFR